MLELYIHDFSEFTPVNLGEDGRFGYSALALYWSDPKRQPFLARTDGQWAGFALLKREAGPEEEVWDMTEFFVLRRFRHLRIGTELAENIWRNCPGKWQIRVMESNVPASKFWESCIERFTGHAVSPSAVQADGIAWRRYSFET